MTKRSAIALLCDSQAGPSSRFSRFFNLSHDKTPNLMVCSEISFRNEMFLFLIKTEIFAVVESKLIFLM